MALLEVKNVSKIFGGLKANQDISFEVEQGQIVGLIGPNGAGKTTLFNCLSGFYRPEAGRIIFQGREINLRGVTIMLVEHVMEVLMPVADRVIVLQSGIMIAAGNPQEIARNPAVLKAYLGEDYGG